MQPFLALITPVGDTGGGQPQPPLGIWGGRPPNYVDIGGPGPQPPRPVPPGYWGGVAPPYVDIGGPQPQPPRPGAPPGYWGGVAPPYVDIGGPGPQPHPEHPIYIPAPPTSPPGSPPIAVQLPVFPWTPSHPIQLPPDVVPPSPPDRPIDWKVAWTPTTGWIVVGIPSGAHPAPST
jgi:hypothetical protein